MSRTLDVASTGSVETWTLCRPEARNALDPELVDELRRDVDRAEQDGVRAVVLTGSGAGFCAGADLRYLLECASTGTSPRSHLRRICDLTLALEASPVVFVAALHGFAVAGGLELALACDLVVAAVGTKVGDGHVRNNLVPGGGASVRLPRKLGPAMASRLALSGELLPAEELLTTGWLCAVTPADLLLPTALDRAAAIARQPPAAQQRYKALLTADRAETDGALERELDTFDQHWEAADVVGSLTTFLDGRGGRPPGSRIGAA